jgi:hypothetical protein
LMDNGIDKIKNTSISVDSKWEYIK